MKTLALVLLCIAAGCTSPKPGRIVVAPTPPIVVPDDLTERVRYPELVKGYHVSRYVDPNGTLMHEAHTVYRVEAQAIWNLRSPAGAFILPSGAVALTNATFAPSAVNDAVIAEVNQQRALTRAVTQQAESLNGSLREFTAALANTRTLAEENKILREQLTQNGRRIEALETQLKRPKSPPAEKENH